MKVTFSSRKLRYGRFKKRLTAKFTKQAQRMLREKIIISQSRKDRKEELRLI